MQNLHPTGWRLPTAALVACIACTNMGSPGSGGKPGPTADTAGPTGSGADTAGGSSGRDTGSVDSGDADSDTGEAPTPRTGEQLYAEECARCHGTEGQGNIGPPMDISVGNNDVPRLMEIVIEGYGDMPPIAVTTEEAERVSAHVHETWSR
ncbi:MAG: cytochrome c [Myxococcota bacterium]|nr:cytochrome c [Myxococcota bacterium]